MEIKKIYFDMDCVLADFYRGVEELCGINIEELDKVPEMRDEKMWDAIREIDHFYDKLEIMEDAREMFEMVFEKYGDRVEILSAIPKPKRRIQNAKEDKILWIRRLFDENIVINIVYTEEKKDYCLGEGYILIDDNEKTINSWNEKGGLGIVHKTAKDTIKFLKETKII